MLDIALIHTLIIKFSKVGPFLQNSSLEILSRNTPDTCCVCDDDDDDNGGDDNDGDYDDG